MRRFPAFAFGALVVATVLAFFITQHLKVSDPLFAHFRLSPKYFNPVDGRVCTYKDKPTSFKRTLVSFDLPDHSDDVGVSIVNSSGQVVRNLGWRQMRLGKQVGIPWNGRTNAGGYAPAGTYYVRIELLHEGRTFDATDTLHILTTPPAPRVTLSGPTTLTPPNGGRVTIHFGPTPYRYAHIVVYRSSAAGRLTPVLTYGVGTGTGRSYWNGEIDHRPAPAGTYLIGVDVADLACNLGRFPATNPPVASEVAHAGVTVTALR